MLKTEMMKVWCARSFPCDLLGRLKQNPAWTQGRFRYWLLSDHYPCGWSDHTGQWIFAAQTVSAMPEDQEFCDAKSALFDFISPYYCYLNHKPSVICHGLSWLISCRGYWYFFQPQRFPSLVKILSNSLTTPELNLSNISTSTCTSSTTRKQNLQRPCKAPSRFHAVYKFYNSFPSGCLNL